MESLPALNILFNALMAKEAELREAEFSLENAEMRMAYDTAIDLWDGFSKGVGSYDEALNAYRSFAESIKHNMKNDFTSDGEKHAYREIIELIPPVAR